jgi:thymidylate synthase (FAD)
MYLLEKDLKSQDAREVLPNALKTEVVVTGFVSDWKHFFELRTAGNAHPDIRALALNLQEQFKQMMFISK